jgi:hypothetical protein
VVAVDVAVEAKNKPIPKQDVKKALPRECLLVLYRLVVVFSIHKYQL